VYQRVLLFLVPVAVALTVDHDRIDRVSVLGVVVFILGVEETNLSEDEGSTLRDTGSKSRSSPPPGPKTNDQHHIVGDRQDEG
jgi:hypothetical protein